MWEANINRTTGRSISTLVQVNNSLHLNTMISRVHNRPVRREQWRCAWPWYSTVPHYHFIVQLGRRWSASDILDGNRRRRPQLHAGCLICLIITSLFQTHSPSLCRDRCTGSRYVGVSTAPDGPIRGPQTHSTTSEGPRTAPTREHWALWGLDILCGNLYLYTQRNKNSIENKFWEH